MKIQDQILLEENELKPNRYAASAMLYSLLAIFIVLMLNVLGIFFVNPVRMNVCFLVVLACSLAGQVVGRNRRVSANPKAKYFVLGLVFLETLTITTMLSQWTELLIALPIVLALQYHNRGMTLYALGGAVFISLVAAPLSIFLELPQVDYYQFLVRSVGYKVESLVQLKDYNKWDYMFRIFKYISIPRCLIATALGVIAVNITKLVTGNIQSRIDATYYSVTDIMTGIYNRYSFSSRLKEYEKNRPDQLICVYADANGLHELNNEFGHEAGDNMIRTAAREMSEAFGELTYRLGGDEFLSFVENGDLETTAAGIEKIRRVMEEKGYQLSLGFSVLQPGQTVDELVKEADNQMFINKHDYYVRSGKDRRKKRS